MLLLAEALDVTKSNIIRSTLSKEQRKQPRCSLAPVVDPRGVLTTTYSCACPAHHNHRHVTMSLDA